MLLLNATAVGKKEKNKKKKKDKIKLLKSVPIGKTECCGKFKKSEDKRCNRCPMLDLVEKRI